MKKEDLQEILNSSASLRKYIMEYLYTEYNTSKNTRNSYAYDLILFAKFFESRDVAFLKKMIFKNTLEVEKKALLKQELII